MKTHPPFPAMAFPPPEPIRRSAAPRAGKSTGEFLFPPTDAGECHASTLTELPDGTLLAAWFAGSKEGCRDVRIYWTRRRPDDDCWSVPRRIPSVEHAPHWNPVLFTMPQGEARIFFKIGTTIAEWRTFHCSFDPENDRWSSPVELVPGDFSGGRGPVKNKPILLSGGAILAPGSVERNSWRAFVDRSEDGGRSWRRSGFIPVPEMEVNDIHSGNCFGVIQPTLWESAPGRVHMLLRSNHRFLYRSDSDDGGLSWSTARPTTLPNNNSGIDLVRLRNGILLLAANQNGENWGPRNRLVLFRSEDNGDSWEEIRVLDAEPLPPEGAGTGVEFSYPAIIVLRNGDVALSYTWKRRSIRFHLFPAESFMKSPRRRSRKQPIHPNPPPFHSVHPATEERLAK